MPRSEDIEGVEFFKYYKQRGLYAYLDSEHCPCYRVSSDKLREECNYDVFKHVMLHYEDWETLGNFQELSKSISKDTILFFMPKLKDYIIVPRFKIELKLFINHRLPIIFICC